MGARDIVLAAGLGLLAAALAAPPAAAICPRDPVQCYVNQLNLGSTFDLNPLGVATLDIPDAAVDGRTLVAHPGMDGEVRVELLEPATARVNVTVSVGDVAGIDWHSDKTRSFPLSGFANATFDFRVDPEAPAGAIAVPVNVTTGNQTAPMQLAFNVGQAKQAGDSGPTWFLVGLLAGGGLAGVAFRHRWPKP